MYHRIQVNLFPLTHEQKTAYGFTNKNAKTGKNYSGAILLVQRFFSDSGVFA
jgi:hypothetical protein